jgi:hypothetical protein
VGVKIAQKWVGDVPQAFCPGGQARDAVNAETQNLGLDPIEPVKLGLVRWDLAGSYGCPGQWEENQSNIALSQVIVQVDALPQVAFQFIIGGRLPNF